jgi:membrane-bound ClpP family serine protease
MMVVVGVVLVLIGVALLVAEAHLPAGVLGVAGGISMATGAALAIVGAGAGALLAIPVAVGAAAIAGVWMLIAARGALQSQGLRARSGREGLCGHTGTVRSWAGRGGQVLVDGALWGARPSIADEGSLEAGDEVVVERVSGLTLCVRKAEEWESQWS